MKARAWLPIIEGDPWPNSSFAKYILLQDGDESGRVWKVFGVDQQAVISTFNSGWYGDFVDENSVLDVSPQSGLTFTKLNVLTGLAEQSWKPFWWVLPERSLSLFQKVIYAIFGFVPRVEPVPLMCFVSTYWVGLCFRLRGWEFARSVATVDGLTEVY